VSVSLDPQIDNPERLKDWAVKFGVKSGWTFVTGDKARIDRVARAFTGGPAEKGDHSEALFIGNDSTQVWLRANGLAGTERLKEMVDRVSKSADPHLPEGQRAR
jgi:protein SCO1/2